MVDIIDEYAEKVANRKADELKIEIAKNLLFEGMSVEFVARTAKLPLVEEVRKLAEKRSA